MQCASCGARKPRRQCPALGRAICTVCCGTKRGVEIRCPPDCVYLRAARTHPPAVQRRQQERDIAVLLPAVRDLNEEQATIYWLTATFIGGYRGDGLLPVTDEEVADAAGALASTYETAARGLIYEHRPASLAAQRLATDLTKFFEQLSHPERRLSDATLGAVLRAVERGAREARKALEGGSSAYLQLTARLRRATADGTEDREDGRAAAGHEPLRLIVP